MIVEDFTENLEIGNFCFCVTFFLMQIKVKFQNLHNKDTIG